LLASKVSKDNGEATNNFLDYYSKPTLAEVKMSLKSKKILVKQQLLRLLAIRQITIIENEDTDRVLLKSTCTCPDFFRTHTYQHLIKLFMKNFKNSLNLIDAAIFNKV